MRGKIRHESLRIFGIKGRRSIVKTSKEKHIVLPKDFRGESFVVHNVLKNAYFLHVNERSHFR